MTIFDPRQTGSGEDPARIRKPEDAPLPTRFGRDRRRRRPQSEPATRVENATGEPRVAGDDEPPFEDHGGL